MKKVGHGKFIAIIISLKIFAYMDAIEKDIEITVNVSIQLRILNYFGFFIAWEN